MPQCRACRAWLDEDERCHFCRTYHCIECRCQPRLDPNALVLLPLLLRRHEEPGTAITGSTAEATGGGTEVATGSEPPVQSQNSRDYAYGAAALAMLGAAIYYSTYSDRRSSGPGHWKTSAFNEIEHVSKLLRTTGGTGVPSSLSIMPSRWSLYTEAFKLGVNPMPMPFPRVFASRADMIFAARLGVFASFANESELARLQSVVDQGWSESVKRGGFVEQATQTAVKARSRVAFNAGGGYASGTMTYSFITRSIPILNSSVLMLQIPYDGLMMFNQLAVNVGRTAGMLRAASPAQYIRVDELLRAGVGRIATRSLPFAGFALAAGVGAGLWKAVLSRKQSSEEA